VDLCAGVRRVHASCVVAMCAGVRRAHASCVRVLWVCVHMYEGICKCVKIAYAITLTQDSNTKHIVACRVL